MTKTSLKRDAISLAAAYVIAEERGLDNATNVLLDDAMEIAVRALHTWPKEVAHLLKRDPRADEIQEETITQLQAGVVPTKPPGEPVPGENLEWHAEEEARLSQGYELGAAGTTDAYEEGWRAGIAAKRKTA